MNAELATLTDTDGTSGSDTITLTAKDSFNNQAAPQTIAVTVSAESHNRDQRCRQGHCSTGRKRIYY